ncbi:MAG: DNA repair protein RecO [Proteobacteria bacterium]|nr:DNA repair protein RecO [Pseudomonadota bacterium]MBU1420084.1 DNA repair protein RecO [Pseudomonadota bacterium]MBU1454553.1 DNA repair protein RecO [Pseudomonadota bacterium]
MLDIHQTSTAVSDRGSKQQLESAAIILDCREHGESDLIVTFFCRDHGRLTGIAKGAKRSKKRFVNKLEIFTSLLIRHTMPENRRLAFIAEAELLKSFLTLRQDISCYTTANVIRECILLATQEMEGDEQLYPLLIWAFTSLDSGRPPQAILILFLIRFFTAIGYSPQLRRCLNCSQEVHERETYTFYTTVGTIRCSNCSKREESSGTPLSLGTIKSLTAAQDQPLDRLQRLQLSPHSQKEALSFLHHYGRQLFQREIISWSFLDTISSKNVYRSR